MASQVVSLPVTASIPIDCDFWSEDDGWKGLSKSPSVMVCGNSFEAAKKNMATELQTQIEIILHEHPAASSGELLESRVQLAVDLVKLPHDCVRIDVTSNSPIG